MWRKTARGPGHHPQDGDGANEKGAVWPAPLPAGPVVFAPSLRTAAELVRREGSTSPAPTVPPHAA